MNNQEFKSLLYTVEALEDDYVEGSPRWHSIEEGKAIANKENQKKENLKSLEILLKFFKEFPQFDNQKIAYFTKLEVGKIKKLRDIIATKNKKTIKKEIIASFFKGWSRGFVT